MQLLQQVERLVTVGRHLDIELLETEPGCEGLTVGRLVLHDQHLHAPAQHDQLAPPTR